MSDSFALPTCNQLRECMEETHEWCVSLYQEKQALDDKQKDQVEQWTEKVVNSIGRGNMIYLSASLMETYSAANHSEKDELVLATIRNFARNRVKRAKSSVNRNSSSASLRAELRETITWCKALLKDLSEEAGGMACSL